MLELGNLETRRVIGDGNCGCYAFLASCAAAKELDRLLEQQPCDVRRGRLMGKDMATMKFLRRLAVRALNNTEWGRKLCLKHLPSSGEATWFWVTASARASLNAAFVIVGLRSRSDSMSYRDRTGRPTYSSSMPLDALT
eukprot:1627171-Pleurochrysis_carterae.AAC.1